MTFISLIYYGVITLSSTLLFVVEPMIVKKLLPTFGGTSEVWLCSLFFFQLLLFFGYLYARILVFQLLSIRGFLLHLSLLTASCFLLARHAWTPIRFSPSILQPSVQIILTLSIWIGLPFLALASTVPLLQFHFNRHHGSTRGYLSYALSNCSSLIALLLYPTLIEPLLRLSSQEHYWKLVFLAYAASLGSLLVYLRNRDHPPLEQCREVQRTKASQSSTATNFLCFALAMVGSMQLSSISAHITQDIAPVPLLWIAPLALYLVTFILAFSGINVYKRPVVLRIELILLAAIGYVISQTDVNLSMTESLLFFLAELFLSCLICHCELSHRKPPNENSSNFYVIVAAGAACGSFLIAIVSPLLFQANYDIAITFLFTSLMIALITWRDGHTQRMLWATSSLLLGYLCLMLGFAQHRTTSFGSRNFYGTLRVTNNQQSVDKGTLRVLQNGSIQHGAQFLRQPWRKVPTTYYSNRSGLGLALNAHDKGAPRNIAVIGLGTGTIAAYGRSGDSIQFFEINPQVIFVAKSQFSYIRDSPADITITQGDGRRILSNMNNKFDVIVVDAFSGDSIPTHLLTTQAFELYSEHLAQNGLLAFHISNRYLELGPLVNSLCAFIGFEAREIDSASDPSQGIYAAKWVLSSKDNTFFTNKEIIMSARTIPRIRRSRLWTDDYSSLFPYIHK